MADAATLPRPGALSATQLSGPIVILLVLAMLVVPLPPAAISFLFALNISAGLVILGASLYIPSPSEFSSFPSVLLATTLMRLALNVATARAILLNGYTGPGAAGHVIESFGQFAVGGNFVVGAIIFAILIIINFMVVTKGASRVAEVSARFMLDSLPGRQMAIDAEINAGVLSPQAAERRRENLRREADFFGAMDGASKFVRGDVVAAIIILVVNMLGGLIIGTMQYGLPLADAARTYTLLTVGDGLAAQIPSLTISVAAGLIVTRVATGEDIGRQIQSQLSKYPQALAIAAGIMGAIGLVPQMAHIPFLMFAAALGTRRLAPVAQRAGEKSRCRRRERQSPRRRHPGGQGRLPGRCHRRRSAGHEYRLRFGAAGRPRGGASAQPSHRRAPALWPRHGLPRPRRAYPRFQRPAGAWLPLHPARRLDRRRRSLARPMARHRRPAGHGKT